LLSDGYDMQTGNIGEPSKVRYGIIFIDEIHRMKKSLTELLHTALEDFKLSMKIKNPLTGRTQSGLYWMPKFTLIGATNYLGVLPRLMVKTPQGRQITELGLHHLGQQLQESRFLKA
jgi:Holliday junction resolvasome RuvABC ATP-dependent DNA helicase subunit